MDVKFACVDGKRLRLRPQVSLWSRYVCPVAVLFSAQRRAACACLRLFTSTAAAGLGQVAAAGYSARRQTEGGDRQ